ncbi:MAG: HEAT repeat domain-containing protein, partial [Methanoregula sp.]|nr:HEAT repeat domain-containing protein [Methanoregula sp.]
MENPVTPLPGRNEKQDPLPEEGAAIEEVRKKRVSAYIRLLTSESLDARWKAAEALGDERDATAVEPLIAALHDPYVDVQWI